MSLAEKYGEILKSVARNENVLNPNIGFPQETNKGDGYIGKMCFIDIKGTNKNLQVALKTAPEHPGLREKTGIDYVFKNEVMFYTDYNKILQKLQGTIENPFVVAKCYHSGLEYGREHLILQNLKSVGYTMWDRKNMMDRKHVNLVIKQYANLHALSYVLKEKDIASFDFIAENVVNVLDVIYMKDEESNEGWRRIMRKFVDGSPETFKNEDVKIKLNEFIQNFPGIIKEACGIKKDSVLCHGDCWCNNMMFKYENDNLIDMKLLDFQILRIANPVLDLCYFLYSSAPKDIYDDIDDLLQIYHEALIERAKTLGVDVTMTLDELKNYWKLYGRFGLLMAFVLVKALLADGEDDTPDIAKEMDQGGEVLDAFNYELKNDKEYYKRLSDLVLHCYENGFI